LARQNVKTEATPSSLIENEATRWLVIRKRDTTFVSAELFSQPWMRNAPVRAISDVNY
jgi:hypothetical protein